MLVLKNLVKEYRKGDKSTRILDHINLEFKDNEFVSVLGLTDSGNTILLNIIGGLDGYTSGKMLINGKSANTFSESDWNTYRCHSIGFVFQRYNLFENRTVLANVELALAVSGAAKSERREKAVEALKRVGLGGQLYRTPDQISPGQRQRTLIARALVNDPDIILADELPCTLGLETGAQIMELFRDIAKDKLVIMAASNPEYADKYFSRVITLSDGQVQNDSQPYHVVVKKPLLHKKGSGGKWPQRRIFKISFMHFIESLSFSIKSLMLKTKETLMLIFAGSIAVIGLAMFIMLGVIRILPYRGVVGIAAVLLMISSIMMGSIQYNSLVRRKKETGILRSIGASKKDIYRIITGEAGIIGFLSGVAGVYIITSLSIMVNMITKGYIGTAGAGALNVESGILLILISIAVNMLAGFLTFIMVCRKDPAAIRTM